MWCHTQHASFRVIRIPCALHNHPWIWCHTPGNIISTRLFWGAKKQFGWNIGGIQALEAMLYTLDKINGDKILLPNITIGAHILDDCDRDTYGLEMAVDFIKGMFEIILQVINMNSIKSHTYGWLHAVVCDVCDVCDECHAAGWSEGGDVFCIPHHAIHIYTYNLDW